MVYISSFDIQNDGSRGSSLNADGKTQSGLSMFATVAQCVKTIMGAGILTLSWAFYQSSMWPGVLLSLVMCLLSAYTFYILGVCSEITGKKVYGEIWTCAYGVRTAWIPNAIVFFLTALSLVACFTIIGDYLPLAIHGLGYNGTFLTFGESEMIHRRVVIVGIWSLLLPLHFRKNLSCLGCLSVVGTLGTLYAGVLLFGKTVERFDQQADWEHFKVGPGVFLTIPSLAFAFNGHFNAPEIYQRLECRSSSRWLLVTACSFFFSLVLILIYGVSGYLMFGSELNEEGRSNVLTAPQFEGRPEVMLAYLGTCVSVSLSIPLFAASACEALELLFLRYNRSTEAVGTNRNRSTLVMVVVLVSTMATSMVAEDLGLINAIGGAVCASMNMFVLPSLMYMRVAGGGVLTSSLSSFRTYQASGSDLAAGLPMQTKLLNWTSVVIGILVAVLGVAVSVMDAMGFKM